MAGGSTYQAQPSRPYVFISAPVDAIKPVLLEDLLSWGYVVRADAPYLLVADRRSDNALATALLGSTTNTRLSFVFTPKGDRTKVTANMAVVTNPGTAFESNMDMNGSVDAATVQEWLVKVRRQIEGDRP